MHPPIFVREPSAEERARLEAAPRASDAFTVRRARIALLSAEGRRPREIARDLRCAVQTVRDGARAFNAAGVGALTAGSSRPESAAPVLGAAELGRPSGGRPRAASGAPRPRPQRLDARAAGGGGARARAEPDRAVGRDDPAGAAAAGGRLEAGERWLTSPDPAYA